MPICITFEKQRQCISSASYFLLLTTPLPRTHTHRSPPWARGCRGHGKYKSFAPGLEQRQRHGVQRGVQRTAGRLRTLEPSLRMLANTTGASCSPPPRCTRTVVVAWGVCGVSGSWLTLSHSLSPSLPPSLPPPPLCLCLSLSLSVSLSSLFWGYSCLLERRLTCSWGFKDA